MRTSIHPHRRGFTLVELMIVVIIIGLLAAIVVPAVMRARETAVQFRVFKEITEINSAMEEFAKDHGQVYPPNFNNYNDVVCRNQLIAYMSRAFPRCVENFTITSPPAGAMPYWFTYAYNGNANQIPKNLDQAEAIVFWLSMISKDPQRPFIPPTGSTLNIYYEFRADQLVDRDNDGWMEYVVRDIRDTSPLVYFGLTNAIWIDSSGNPQCAQYPADSSWGTTSTPTGFKGVARPYSSDTPVNANVSAAGFLPAAKNRFQLLFAGRDADFGADTFNSSLGPNSVPAANQGSPYDWGLKHYPKGTNYGRADDDNMTNFSEGKTLWNAKP